MASWTRAGADLACSLSVGWEPYGVYSYVEADGKVAGVDIDLMKALASDISCKVTFRQLPWPRHLLELQAGLVDVATSVRKSSERAAYGWFSEPYRQVEFALFVHRGQVANYHLTSLEGIAEENFRLGIVDGYYYGPMFAGLMKRPEFARQIEGALDYGTNIRKLVHGRIDGVLAEDVNVLIQEAKTLGLYESLEIYPLAIPGDELHLLFSKQSVTRATVAAINASLRKLKADGRLQQIFDRYLH